MRDSELRTGLTKASPVVIPEKMAMTTLNLDLHGEAKQEADFVAISSFYKHIVKYRIQAG